MANNLFAGRPAAVVAKITIPIDQVGITALNTARIYRVDSPLKSYVPGRAINGFTDFENGQGYYIIPISDMDLSTILAPPNEGGGGIGAFTVS